MDKYVEILAAYFEINPFDLEREYIWPRSKPVPFDETFQRRQAWSKTFNSEAQIRERLAFQVVVEWGGIKRGSSNELKTMAAELPDQLINRGFRRIASWSKVLILHDPEEYLIYDARVASAINLILYKSRSIDTFFPMPPSRNSHIGKAAKSKTGIQMRLGKSKRIGGQNFYRAYLLLAKNVAKQIGCPAWQIEMALFARGPALAREAV